MYLRGEPAVRGRAVLAALRVGAILVVVALLMDVRLPDPDVPGGADGAGHWVLIDAELSLLVPGADSTRTLWDEAVATALEAAAEGARIALTAPGGGVERVEIEDIADRAPRHPPGDVSDAVVRLAEAGADSVTVLTSLRWPAGAIEALATRTPVTVRIERLGEPVSNVGILAFDLPETIEADAPSSASVELFAEAVAGDTVTIEVRADGDLVASATVPAPGPGMRRTVDVDLPPPPDTGLVRYTASALLAGDVFSDDDLRSRWTEVGGARPGIVLVSVRPDWEPRTLVPVLEAVTGLEGQGYLQLGEGSFLPLIAGGGDVGSADSATVVRAIEESELLVVHGVGPVVPDWLSAAASSHPRVLHFPTGLAGDRLGGLPEGIRGAGEWMVVPEPPPSPLSAFLSGLALGGLPPLSDLRVGPAPGTVALEAALSGRDPSPALVLVEREEGRRAVARAGGFWRWATRGGDARRVYRALWGGVAEWLPAGGRGSADVRPEVVRQPRGEPVRWLVPASVEASEITLRRLHDGADGAVDPAAADSDTEVRVTLSAVVDRVATTPPVEPGVYGYEVNAPDAPDTAVATGIVEVERWVAALASPPLDAPVDPIAGVVGEGSSTERGGRPLRTHPIPYLLLLVLLSAEWLGRRRAGLR